MTFFATQDHHKYSGNQSSMEDITYNNWTSSIDAMLYRLECVSEAILHSDPYEVITNAEIRRLDLLGLDMLKPLVSMDSEYIRDWHMHKESGNTSIHQSILRLKSNKGILEAVRNLPEPVNLNQHK